MGVMKRFYDGSHVHAPGWARSPSIKEFEPFKPKEKAKKGRQKKVVYSHPADVPLPEIPPGDLSIPVPWDDRNHHERTPLEDYTSVQEFLF